MFKKIRQIFKKAILKNKLNKDKTYNKYYYLLKDVSLDKNPYFIKYLKEISLLKESLIKFEVQFKQNKNEEELLRAVKAIALIEKQTPNDYIFVDQLNNIISKLPPNIEFLEWIAKKGFHRIYQLFLKVFPHNMLHYDKNQEIFESFMIELYNKLIEHKNIKNIHIFKDKNADDKTSLTKEGKYYYRNLTKEKVKLWQRLISAKIPVEEIVEIKTKRNTNKNPLIGNLYVKSKDMGINAYEYIYHSTNKKNKNIIPNIIKQMITTISKVWEQGVVHRHPHLGNWTIKIEKGKPKVYLIDFNEAFDLLKTVHPMEITIELGFDYSMLIKIINQLYVKNLLSKDMRKKLIYYLKTKYDKNKETLIKNQNKLI